MKSIRLLFNCILLSLCFAACGELDEQIPDNDVISHLFKKEQSVMNVVEMDFSSDNKSFVMTVDAVKDYGAYDLADSSLVRYEVFETVNGIRKAKFSAPELKKITNIEAERIKESDVKMLVLVDLSMSQADLQQVHDYLGEISTAFKYDNLYVAFMDSLSVTPTMKATEYVLNKYLAKPKSSSVRLYRSMLQKRDEMMRYDSCWHDADKLVMLTISKGKLYFDNSDEPIDPDHFRFQESMLSVDSMSLDTNFAAYYVDMAGNQADGSMSDENILRIFCNNSGGGYFKDFHWTTIKNKILENIHKVFPDYELCFENPEFKVYRGDNKKLTVNFYDSRSDSLIATMSTIVNKGDVFNPIIVHGHNIIYVVLQGIFLGAVVIILLYIVFQLILPFVKNEIFQHKYIITYTGKNMSFNNNTVDENCYYCKSPFEEGDSIVVKCRHVMHKECWEENGHHCPEYSDRCKEGSHYYNKSNLFDRRNAPYYFKWILMSLVAAVLSWVCFSFQIHSDFYEHISIFAHSSVSQPPILGFYLGFFLALGINLIYIRPGKDIAFIGRILLRSFIIAMACMITFVLINMFIYLFHIERFTILLNWIPWTASGFIIAYGSSSFSNRGHNKLILLSSFLVGFLSMNVWNFLFLNLELDYRVLLLVSFMIYSIGLMACIATSAPHSERYFLKIQGAAKGIDIALYKWFRNNTEGVVTLGKSVDCALQMSWDIQGDIAPVQAEIRLFKRIPYLIPLEPGVFIGDRPVKVGKKIRLFHGKSFTIGKTTFSYIEKDR